MKTIKQNHVGLRKALFEDWTKLRLRTISPVEAQASAAMASIILKSVSLEMATRRLELDEVAVDMISSLKVLK
jgi:hypothetical protein